ncbi:MAG TPA: hypothetical protein VFR41_03330 [Acidimicrobiia bacterium]|nr:hypothetical protein [Acidimicrobiia bacterium]
MALAACSSGTKTVTPVATTTTIEPSTTTRAPRSTTTTPQSEHDQWIAAATDGVLAGNSSDFSANASQAACLGHALIDTVGVAKLKAAGVTLETLRDPNVETPPELARMLTTDEKTALGRAIQACGVGALFGEAFATKITDGFDSGYRLDSDAEGCLAAGFSAPARALTIADLVLHSTPSGSDATALASVLVDCLNWGRIFGAQLKLALSAGEMACINSKARSDVSFTTALAGEVTGDATAIAKLREFGVSITLCLTTEHLAAIAKANQSNE